MYFRRLYLESVLAGMGGWVFITCVLVRSVKASLIAFGQKIKVLLEKAPAPDHLQNYLSRSVFSLSIVQGFSVSVAPPPICKCEEYFKVTITSGTHTHTYTLTNILTHTNYAYAHTQAKTHSHTRQLCPHIHTMHTHTHTL